MSGMTSERLAEIRANLPDPSADLSRRERDSHALLAHVDHLTDENARLREGIAALADRLDPLARIWQEEGEIELSVPMKSQVASLRALLNPPTEGETDHE